jgi:hypothetical protein
MNLDLSDEEAAALTANITGTIVPEAAKDTS